MKATASQFASAWYSSLKSADVSQWDEISQRFLEHLHTAGNLKQLPHIKRLMKELETAERGVTEVTVRTAHDRSENDLLPLIKEVLGEQNVSVTLVSDDSLIGGIQIETRNKRYDLSLAGELRQLKKTLT
jgi:F0F1-type ATP synthase delta subunit